MYVISSTPAVAFIYWSTATVWKPIGAYLVVTIVMRLAGTRVSLTFIQAQA